MGFGINVVEIGKDESEIDPAVHSMINEAVDKMDENLYKARLIEDILPMALITCKLYADEYIEKPKNLDEKTLSERMAAISACVTDSVNIRLYFGKKYSSPLMIGFDDPNDMEQALNEFAEKLGTDVGEAIATLSKNLGGIKALIPDTDTSLPELFDVLLDGLKEMSEPDGSKTRPEANYRKGSTGVSPNLGGGSGN